MCTDEEPCPAGVCPGRAVFARMKVKSRALSLPVTRMVLYYSDWLVSHTHMHLEPGSSPQRQYVCWVRGQVKMETVQK